MDTALRDILMAVREGRIDPAEAARLLDDPPARSPNEEPGLRSGGERPAPFDDLSRAEGPERSEPAEEAERTDAERTGAEDAERTGAEDAERTERSDAEGSDADSAERGPTDEPGAAGRQSTSDEQAGQSTSDEQAGRQSTSDEREFSAAWADATDDIAPPRRTTGPTPSSARSRSSSTTPVGEASTATSATTALRIRAITRRVRILGDPTVATVSIDGPHELRREGSVLVCDSDRDLPIGDPFAFLPSGLGRFRVKSPGRSFGWNADLVIRLNPALDVEVDVTAGSLSVTDVGRVRARVTAGSVRVEDVRGPLDLHVVGGSAKIDMVMVGGDNRIRCDSGSVVLRLRRGSDVRFRPEAQLGRIVVDGVEGGREISVGKGAGRLRAEVVMGSIQVEVDA